MADLVTWPVTLPDPRASGYSITPVTAFSRTDMDNGTARQRRRFTRVPSYVAVTWRMTHFQFAIFEGFLAYDIGLGTSWFSVNLLNGLEMNAVQARFMSDPPYKAAISDSRAWFDVTAQLEVKALPVATKDEYSVMRIYTEVEIAAMGDPLHKLIHEDLPGPKRWN
jgi:hypothetical protein